MGHSTARAALVYLHGSDQRQHEIAQALTDLAAAEMECLAKRPEDQPPRRATGTRQERYIMR
jgi:hypothetical protein